MNGFVISDVLIASKGVCVARPNFIIRFSQIKREDTKNNLLNDTAGALKSKAYADRESGAVPYQANKDAHSYFVALDNQSSDNLNIDTHDDA